MYKLNMRVQKNNRGQMSAAFVTGLVMGTAALVITAIIALVVVDTLTSADLVSDGRDTVTVLNELGHVNITGHTLTGTSADYVPGTFTISGLVNYTDGTTFLLPNATTSAAGVVTNASTSVWNNVTINYTYSLKAPEEHAQDNMGGNFSDGINEVSSKIPNILKIAAVVLILSILALLFAVWKQMKMGGSI